MKILNFLLAVMFLFFAFLQVNDPDPVLWILIYGSMAVVAILAMFEVYISKVILTLMVAFVAYSLFYIGGVRTWLAQEDKSALFDDVAKMEHLYIEESREFLGLWICIFVLIFYYIRSTKRRR